MWWGHGFGWASVLFGVLMMLLFWGGLIALVVLVIRGLSGQTSTDSALQSSSTSTTALDILKERYARGEITRAEYEEMRDVIESES